MFGGSASVWNLSAECTAASLSHSLHFCDKTPPRIQLLCTMLISNLYRIGLGGQRGRFSLGCCHGNPWTRDNHWTRRLVSGKA